MPILNISNKSRSKMINLKNILLISLITTITSCALSFSVNKNYLGYNLIYASGNIRYGDLYKLKRKYNSLSKQRQTIVVFNSNGGELNEGIKIGKFLKSHGIGSAVRKNGICASSCALAFLGGRDKSGRKLMILPRSASLGFHSFYYKNRNYVKLNKVQKDISNILNYASYVDAPNYLMAKMFDTNSDNMYWINYHDRKALNIKSGLSGVKLKKYVRKKSKKSKKYTQNYNNGYLQPAKAYVEEYISNINNMITSSRGLYFINQDTAFNNQYVGWLNKNLQYIHIKKIKQISPYKVETKVIYSFYNGSRICSKNRYTLAKSYTGKWSIINKTYKGCNYKSRKLLKKVAKALP